MPIYEYLCEECGQRHEALQRLSDSPLTECPECDRPALRKLISADVDETNRRLSKEPMMAASQIRRFLILHKELDADDGELTRTRKVRRSVINEKYADIIDAIYAVGDMTGRWQSEPDDRPVIDREIIDLAHTLGWKL
jgi:putative FmdB family regulatory protein